MSEANVLNPAAGNLMNPDYTIPITDPDIMAMWQARSGKAFNRDMLARGRVFELHWDKADFTTYRALRQWSAQYRRDFFSYFDIEDNRYYSGRFAEGSFKHERNENNQVNVSATFAEIPGLPMFQYPSNWGVDSAFIEERDGFGGDLVKLTGAGWSFIGPGNPVLHGGGGYASSETNDTAEWLYVGYGFRFWSIKQASDGIVEISLDGTVLGTVDLYNVTETQPAPLWTQQNVSLGSHRVKLRVTGTKNVASSGTLCWADAIEVMH